MALTMASAFAGIGGFDLAARRCGIQTAAQIEIEPFPRKVLRKRFPEARLLGDITKVKGEDIGAIDLLTGGFPCQDLSVAGKRAGLAGGRSGLFFELARLAAELAPRWVFFENVPGLLSSNGWRDFGAILGTLGELGYGYAWRVLDAQPGGRGCRPGCGGCLMPYYDFRLGATPKNAKPCARPDCSHVKGAHGSRGGKFVGPCGRTDCTCPEYVAAEEVAG